MSVPFPGVNLTEFNIGYTVPLSETSPRVSVLRNGMFDLCRSVCGAWCVLLYGLVNGIGV